MTEIWKQIKGYQNYEVSNFGNIKIINFRKTGKPKIKKTGFSPDGYVLVSLWDPELKKLSTHKVHRLVLCTFTDTDYKTNKIVMHMDDNPANNCINNLKFGTHMENCHDCIRKGRANKAFGENNGDAKLKESQVIQIKHLLRYGVSCNKIAEYYGVGKSTIGYIKQGKTWKHLLNKKYG